jgi:hypothetical protein
MICSCKVYTFDPQCPLTTPEDEIKAERREVIRHQETTEDEELLHRAAKALHERSLRFR